MNEKNKKNVSTNGIYDARELGASKMFVLGVQPVSYTHLTQPTICSV